MTAVTISGTFSKDTRPSNGLEEISAELIKDQLGRHFIVGVVQFCGASVPGPNEPLAPRVKFLAIEPLKGEAAEQVEQILDQARKERGLGITKDLPAGGGELHGQGEFDFDEPRGDEPGEAETRLTGDGPREVPPPSGEEIMAEREEAAADAEAARRNEAEAKRAEIKARRAKPTASPFETPGVEA